MIGSFASCQLTSGRTMDDGSDLYQSQDFFSSHGIARTAAPSGSYISNVVEVIPPIANARLLDSDISLTKLRSLADVCWRTSSCKSFSEGVDSKRCGHRSLCMNLSDRLPTDDDG